MSRRHPFILSSVVAVAALSLLAAGCGGGSSPRVANIGSSTTEAPTTGEIQDAVIAFAACMRHHGVPDLPDPTASPRGFKETLNDSSPEFKSALATCQHLLPNGGQREPATITPADQTIISGPPPACGDTVSPTSPIRRSGTTPSRSTSRRTSTGAPRRQ
jgi:hypothetical protein